MTIERRENLARAFDSNEPWDFVVIGGGATGMGIALDAAARGYRCVLLEQSDFGKGTSSRSTKLVHGGVRYLRQGRIGLVREALGERAILLRNAPHLVHPLPFVVPSYRWWERPYYAMGLVAYDLLAGGRSGLGRSRPISRRELLSRSPGINPDGLRGGVLYFDGQFDDARLLINLAQTAADRGAVVLNYVRVERIEHDSAGRACGVMARDVESGRETHVRARCLINATGAFCDALRHCDDARSRPLVAPSQGAHVVLDRSFLPGDSALMVPRTDDGRVIFAIPWHDHVLVGTTDTPIESTSLEPRPLEAEVDFLLETVGRYLAARPQRSDVRSAFAGIRPLVRSTNSAGSGSAARTSQLSRDHVLDVSASGLITIVGGKWTTYRAMAAECVDLAAKLAQLPPRPCMTATLPIRGGDDERHIRELMQSDPRGACPLDPHESLPITAAHVRWAARHEAARSVDDVLARRTRALHLDAAAALRMAPAVAQILAEELDRNEVWQRDQIDQFTTLARQYTVPI